jgi:hypothetical protein
MKLMTPADVEARVLFYVHLVAFCHYVIAGLEF